MPEPIGYIFQEIYEVTQYRVNDKNFDTFEEATRDFRFQKLKQLLLPSAILSESEVEDAVDAILNNQAKVIEILTKIPMRVPE
jgi:hypothetical protein